MTLIPNFRQLFLFLVVAYASGEVAEVTTETFAERRQDDSGAEIVTGTFRFRKVVNQGSRRGANGWQVEGCYCQDGSRCSCAGNRNRVKMFVRTNGSNNGGVQRLRIRGPPTTRLPLPSSTETEGCLCGVNGCEGSSCGSLNGCVCNSVGSCWGSACGARISSFSPVTTPAIASAPLNGLSMVRNAVMSGPVAVTVPPMITSANVVTPTTDPTSCSCNSLGCVGSGCAQLNGCFCIGQSCWGAACQSPVLQPQAQAQISPLIAQQVARQILPNQQSANFLFGDGGGNDLDSQTIPVVKGIPVKALRGQPARGSMRQHSQGRMRYARPPGAMGRGRRRQRQRRRFRDGMQTSSSVNNENARTPMFAAISVNGIPSVMRISGPQARSSSVDFVRNLGNKITESVNQLLGKSKGEKRDKENEERKEDESDEDGEEDGDDEKEKEKRTFLEEEGDRRGYEDCFKQNWKDHKVIHEFDPWPMYDYSGPLRPAPLTPKRDVPRSIMRPDYADHPEGRSKCEEDVKGNNQIKVLDDEEIEGMKLAGKLAREVLEEGALAVGVGVTTDELDRIVHEACIERECYPSPLNYYNFPKSCCTSVNEVICHGIPDLRPLQDGDLCNMDITIYKNGFHGDLNETMLVGKVKDEHVKLVQVTHECLQKAIELIKPGEKYRELGNVIQKHAQANGFSVVRRYCGHGIHRLFHTTPNVPHYAKNKAIGVMKPGHCFTIEPMISEGSWRDNTWPDDWTAVTEDGKRSAQFEQTFLVTETGYEILTRRRTGEGKPYFMDQLKNLTN